MRVVPAVAVRVPLLLLRIRPLPFLRGGRKYARRICICIGTLQVRCWNSNAALHPAAGLRPVSRKGRCADFCRVAFRIARPQVDLSPLPPNRERLLPYAFYGTPALGGDWTRIFHTTRHIDGYGMRQHSRATGRDRSNPTGLDPLLRSSTRCWRRPSCLSVGGSTPLHDLPCACVPFVGCV